VAASNRLLGLPGPTALMLGWTLGFLLLFVAPLGALAMLRRRALRPKVDADPLEDDEELTDA